MAHQPTAPSSTPQTADAAKARQLAVIDVGSTSVRMKIAQVGPEGPMETIETLQQTISLGKDTFTRREIARETIEQCVYALRNFTHVLKEYGIDPSKQLRAVATTAVREALNRQSFLDRLYIATGIQVAVLDDTEVARLTYQAAQSLFNDRPDWVDTQTLIAEVGGGSTALLVLRGKNIDAARAFRIGSLRMRKMLETYHAPVGRYRQIMRSQVQRMVSQIRQEVKLEGPLRLVVFGGDARFAAEHLCADRDKPRLPRLEIDDLKQLVTEVLALSVDDLVQRYHLPYPDAETLGPALLTHLYLARGLEIDHLYVAANTLRDGLLTEMFSRTVWTPEFRDQVIRAALDLGRKFQFDEAHAVHVAARCKTLFNALQQEHQLPNRFELLLYVAALLHEIGLYISHRSHHKHSMYLIQHSELFGLGAGDLMLVAMVARYHRRATPKPNHDGYAILNREHRIAVAKMAAILRVADALERSHSQRVRSIDVSRQDGRLVITVPDVDDLSLEQMALRQKGDMFQQIYGLKVVLRVESVTAR